MPTNVYRKPPRYTQKNVHHLSGTVIITIIIMTSIYYYVMTHAPNNKHNANRANVSSSREPGRGATISGP